MLGELLNGRWLPRVQNNVMDGFATRACANDACGDASSWILEWMRHRNRGIQMLSNWYCSPQCFESGLCRHIQQLLSRQAPVARGWRLPLGLVLLSQGAIDKTQLASALNSQRNSGNGRIGDWLLSMGAVDEQQITKALGEQHCCPVLKSARLCPEFAQWIPFQVLERHGVVPVHYAERTRTLYLAFSERVDRSLLYAIEQILSCRAEACVVPEREMKVQMEAARCVPRPAEVLFEAEQSPSEIARISRSYAVQFQSSEARLAIAGEYVWIRLSRPKQTFNILFRSSCGAQSAQLQEDFAT